MTNEVVDARRLVREERRRAEVLHVGEVETPKPGPGEVRIKLKTSGVNPSDVKTRAGTDAQDRVSARHPAQRRRGRNRRGRARASRNRASASASGPGMAHGSARSAPPPNTSCCRSAGRAAARRDQLRGGRLPRHSGAHRMARDRHRRHDEGHDAADRGRCGRGCALRDPVRQGARRDRDRDGLVGRKGEARARRRAPTTPSTTRPKMSASA